MKKFVSVFLLLFVIVGCSSNEGGSSYESTLDGDTFELSLSNGISFSSYDERARVTMSNVDMIEFATGFGTNGMKFRTGDLSLEDESITSWDELNFNNTFVHFPLDGVMVACSPAEDPVGVLNRGLSGGRMFGDFEIEFVECEELYNLDTPVDGIDFPLIVKGEFDIAVK